jgi:hypothetical protein
MRGPSLDPWTWTDERERAAQLVADGQRTNDQIAVECGVAGRSLRDWKRCPEFRERVRRYLAEYRAKLAVEGLALKSEPHRPPDGPRCHLAWHRARPRQRAFTSACLRFFRRRASGEPALPPEACIIETGCGSQSESTACSNTRITRVFTYWKRTAGSRCTFGGRD